MSIKSFLVILVLSVVVTVGIPFIDFALGWHSTNGFPFGFSQFSFLGSSTNYPMLILDVAFWFIVIFILWKLVFKK